MCVKSRRSDTAQASPEAGGLGCGRQAQARTISSLRAPRRQDDDLREVTGHGHGLPLKAV
jgi:hypothetical protein